MDYDLISRALLALACFCSALLCFVGAAWRSIDRTLTPHLLFIGLWSLMFGQGMARLAWSWWPTLVSDVWVVSTLNVSAFLSFIGWATLAARLGVRARRVVAVLGPADAVALVEVVGRS